jgi:ATP-binding cassette, subfamily F, member 3
MLSARDLTLRRGPEPLLESANFTIFRGDRVGLTGANGCGKSSLFAAIRGELASDRGDIDRPAGLSIAYVEQEIAASGRSALDFVLDGDQPLRAAEAAIADAERRNAALELAELHAAYLSIDGYRAPARAAAVMHGLGFGAADHARPVGEFSGGWRVRLAMARALSARADLLLLDEPTNHLDLDAIVWLEDWLSAYQGTLMMISHDREFLDRIIDRVLHIENRSISAHTGNYSAFEARRAEQLAQQNALQARQQRRVMEITTFIRRFGAKASKSRQAQSRLKMLRRLEIIDPAHVDSPFEFDFPAPLKIPRPLVTLEDAACGYGINTIVAGLNVSIGPLDRIALLGPNGAGKSTVTRVLAGMMEPLSGRRVAAADLSIGYFAQHQLEQLRPDCDAFWHVRQLGGADYRSGDEQRVRDHLGRFGFRGGRVFEPVSRFSGGEKARLTLALIVARRPNLLLLDEPTNHLDIDMRHALCVALQSFAGGLVLVSHDRHLIKTVADSLWLVADGRLAEYDGDLDDYQQWLRSRARGPAVDSRKKRAADARPARTRAPPVPRLAASKYRFEQLEMRLAALCAERTAVEAGLGGDSQDREDIARLGARHSELSREIEALEAQWLEMGLAFEARV